MNLVGELLDAFAAERHTSSAIGVGIGHPTCVCLRARETLLAEASRSVLTEEKEYRAYTYFGCPREVVRLWLRDVHVNYL